MGRRKVTVRESVATGVANVAWFIESKGMIATADKFSDSVYDFMETLSDERLVHAPCRDPDRKLMGLKCKSFKKKYTIVFFETEQDIMVCEFLISKLINW
jgi:hypothetical protein